MTTPTNNPRGSSPPPPPPKKPGGSSHGTHRGAVPPPPPSKASTRMGMPAPHGAEQIDDLEVLPDTAPEQVAPVVPPPVYQQGHPGGYAPGYAPAAYAPPHAAAYEPPPYPVPVYAPPPPAYAPPAPPPPAPAPEPTATNDELTGEVPDRDRIVILGRRQSGKTIFLASIYARLWRSSDGMTAKALTGDVHKQLMTVHQMLHDGQWPPSTLGTSQIDLEIDYNGKRRLLVALDFAGELFSKAFVDDQSDWPGVKELVNHIDRAAAVLLLVDPSVVAGMDKQAAMEDDFGLVQSAQRIRNWPGGDRVPIVLVLTKMDQHQQLLDRFGGPMGFVRKHFPALLRLLKNIPIVQVSAIQAEAGPDGKPRPKRDSSPINLDHPLRFCLREIERNERRAEIDRIEDQRRAAESRAIADVQYAKRRIQTRVTLGVSAIALVGTAILVLVLVLNI